MTSTYIHNVKPILSLSVIATALFAGCSTTQADLLSFTDDQVHYMATQRCLYIEGILSREQLEQRTRKEAENDPEGFLSPILEAGSSGIDSATNSRIKQEIEDRDCQSRVLSWAAVYLPQDQATEFTIKYMTEALKE